MPATADLRESGHRAPPRLRSSRDILATMRSREQSIGDLVVIHVRRRQDADLAPVAGPRVAVVASRKVGNAVRRNRAKRLLREAARHLHWEPEADVVLVARARAAGAAAEHVASEVADHAERLGVLRTTASTAVR